MKRIFPHRFLLLLLTALTACYQPIDLTPAEDSEIPWVHCILKDGDQQFLDLRYVNTSFSGDFRPVEEAEVKMEIWNQDEDGFFLRGIYPFQRIRSGRWKLDLSMGGDIMSDNTNDVLCRLQVVLPTGDTLHAATTVNSESIKKRVRSDYASSTASYDLGFDLFGQHYSYELRHDGDNPSLYKHEETVRFIIPDINAAVWVYKIGVAEDGRNYIEETLATDREEWVDSFNITGQTFTSSSEPMALSMYPEVAGQPLHNRFLRFPERRQGDILVTISGDFKGRHYACSGLILQAIRLDQIWAREMNKSMGIPYEDNILTTGQAGYLQFLTVSPEYDRYLKDVAQFELLQESTDIISIYRNTNIYSNIEGGIGIFGACVEQDLFWSCGVWEF